MGVVIKNMGYHLSKNRLSNENLSDQFPEHSPEQIYKLTGIQTRYTTGDALASDMAVSAAEELFIKNSIDRSEVDLLMFVSEALDFKTPQTSVIIQDRLGLSNNIMAIDVPMGCSGFTHAIGMAKMFISSGQINSVLVLLGDTPSLCIHPNDFALRSLFSDAGGAVLIGRGEGAEIGEMVYGTDGKGAKGLYAERSGMRGGVDEKWLKDHSSVGGLPFGQLKMDGIGIFTFSLREVPKLVSQILKVNNEIIESVDLFVFHQASLIILKSLQKKLNIPEEKMAYYIEDFGNTVSMSIPIALEEAQRVGRIGVGSKVLVAGFGVGYAWSGTMLYY